jgi:hypothetical protein
VEAAAWCLSASGCTNISVSRSREWRTLVVGEPCRGEEDDARSVQVRGRLDRWPAALASRRAGEHVECLGLATARGVALW